MATKKDITKAVKPEKAAEKVRKPRAVKKPAEETKAVKEVKVQKESKTVKEAKGLSGKYYYAVGRRKSSVSQVRLYLTDSGNKTVIVNDKDISDYFTISRHSEMVKAPLVAAGLEEKFDVSIKSSGGGIMGQAEAAKLGVARALVVYDEGLRKAMKGAGFLTRDARVVERKKPGKRKARRSPQWAKR